jgi:hypothetical protein
MKEEDFLEDDSVNMADKTISFHDINSYEKEEEEPINETRYSVATIRAANRYERKQIKKFKPDENKTIFSLYKKILRLYLELHLEKFYTNKVNKKKNAQIFRFHLDKINSKKILKKDLTEELREELRLDLREDNRALRIYKKLLSLQLNKFRLKRIITIKKDKKGEYEERDPNEPKKVSYLHKKSFRIQAKKVKLMLKCTEDTLDDFKRIDEHVDTIDPSLKIMGDILKTIDPRFIVTY